MPESGTPEWLAQVAEEVLDPHVEIVDPHHHLWPAGSMFNYSGDELASDTTGGHNVVATMFMECQSAYREDGPEHLRSVGETEFVVAEEARMQAQDPAAPPIAGIVAHADLASPALDEILDAHVAAAAGKFRGIRDALCSCDDPALMIPPPAPPEKFKGEAFRKGVRRLAERGFTYDSWHYHYQNAEFAEVARACPNTVMVLDHFGTPLGVGRYAGQRQAIFEEWKIGIADAASCENTVLKAGGLAMPDNGFPWFRSERPPTSDEFIELQGRYYHYAIEQFGPERCMFESNFPVDRLSVGYGVLWNALKKIASRYSTSEQSAMFAGTARRIYSLEA
jgi:L-fuconolactonase